MPEVVFSAEARRDLKAIQSYIGEEQGNPQTALKVIENILSRVEKLIDFPETGTLLAPKVNFQTNYRYVRSSGYLIFYRHEKNQILIDRIIHSLRDYISILDPNINGPA
ncbi:plasmid stabilization protein [Spirochaetia bacterium]|nr:plasmid stabilization protein [Spirochaetia bacterium]